MAPSPQEHDPSEAPLPFLQRRQLPLLLMTVFLIAICGLLYELLISSISTYFLGSSVLHFSVTIGLFMSAMGLGSFLSQYIRRGLLARFIDFQLVLGLVGGGAALLLYAAYTLALSYYVLQVALTLAIGTLVGMEIPLLTRIIQHYSTLRQTLAQVLAFDYVGALVASLLFPLLLLPTLGTMRTSFLVGAINLGVALWNALAFRRQLERARWQAVAALGGIGLLAAGFAYSSRLVSFYEQLLYQDQVIYAEHTKYQRIVLTRWRQDYRLYINSNIQFSSIDEHRYHEPLVHLPMLLAHKPRRVLILGGGDGLAAREVLKHEGIRRVDIVDLDPAMTKLGRRHPALVRLNDSALHARRVHCYNQDAYNYLENTQRLYDVVLIDLPDPNKPSLGKLYSRAFYALLQRRMRAGGWAITQASSPYYARKAFWCIRHTMAETMGAALPYFTHVPSFGGVWGLVLAQKPPGPARHKPAAAPPPKAAAAADSLQAQQLRQRVVQQLEARLPAAAGRLALRYLNAQDLAADFRPAPDYSRVPTVPNTLNNQALVRYYQASWRRWR